MLISTVVQITQYDRINSQIIRCNHLLGFPLQSVWVRVPAEMLLSPISCLAGHVKCVLIFFMMLLTKKWPGKVHNEGGKSVTCATAATGRVSLLVYTNALVTRQLGARGLASAANPTMPHLHILVPRF